MIHTPNKEQITNDIKVGDRTNVGIITHVYSTKVGVQSEGNKYHTILLTPKSEVFKIK
jgi:hypothetical protein